MIENEHASGLAVELLLALSLSPTDIVTDHVDIAEALPAISQMIDHTGWACDFEDGATPSMTPA